MASPNQGQSPTNAGQSRALPIYTPPRSPEEVAREQKRVNLLLEINAIIFQHILQLQGEGMSGLLAMPQNTPDPANMPKMASPEYILCMRTMQANIAWLVASSNGTAGNSRTFLGPVLMDSPIESPVLVQKYEELKKLFPGWRGSLRTGHATQMSQQYAGQGQGPMQMPPHQQHSNQQISQQQMAQQPIAPQFMTQQPIQQQPLQQQPGMNPMQQNFQGSPGPPSNPPG